jgi:RND family efflux transporter MFP subunit
MHVINMKKLYWILIIIAVVVVGVIIFQRQNTKSFTNYTVIRSDISDELLLAGTIDVEKRVDLGFASSGRVKSINFEVGQRIKKGQIIAEIEQNRLAAEFTQAQANLNLTRANSSTDINTAESSLESLRKEQNAIVVGLYHEYLSGDLQAYSLDSSPGDEMTPIVSGSYSGKNEGEYVISVYSSASNSGYSFNLSGLSTGTYSAQEFQPGLLGDKGLYIQFDTRSSYRNTRWIVPVPNTRSSGYVTRKRAYESALATRARVITEAQNNLQRSNGVDAESNISIDQARRDQATAQVNAVSAQLGDGKIRAPFDGIIVRNDLEVGEIISAFTPEITFFGDITKKLRLNTPEIYINKIAVGDVVSVVLDAYPGEVFKGTVDFINVIDTEVNGVPVYETDIILSTDDERIRVGMNAKASVIAEKKESVIAIPNHYITTENGVSTVLLQKNIRPLETEIRDVEIGFKGNNGLVEIVSGLLENDIILLSKK